MIAEAAMLDQSQATTGAKDSSTANISMDSENLNLLW